MLEHRLFYIRDLFETIWGWHGRKIVWGLFIALCWLAAGLLATAAVVSIFTQWSNR